MTNEELDNIFLEEYHKLCEKWNRCLDIYNEDTMFIVSGTCYASIISSKEIEEIDNKQTQLRLKQKEEQEKIQTSALKKYLDNGGKLNIHGEIPTNYSSFTAVWGKSREDFLLARKEIKKLLYKKSYTSQELQKLIRNSMVKLALDNLYEEGDIVMDEQFKLRWILDKGEASD
jgi:hypothetical protein